MANANAFRRFIVCCTQQENLFTMFTFQNIVPCHNTTPIKGKCYYRECEIKGFPNLNSLASEKRWFHSELGIKQLLMDRYRNQRRRKQTYTKLNLVSGWKINEKQFTRQNGLLAGLKFYSGISNSSGLFICQFWIIQLRSFLKRDIAEFRKVAPRIVNYRKHLASFHQYKVPTIEAVKIYRNIFNNWGLDLTFAYGVSSNPPNKGFKCFTTNFGHVFSIGAKTIYFENSLRVIRRPEKLRVVCWACFCVGQIRYAKWNLMVKRLSIKIPPTTCT